MPALLSDVLLSEYETIVAQTGRDASDEQLVAALVCDAEWTDHGARVVAHLARQYGTSILRNSLALAAALGIEDGEAGL